MAQKDVRRAATDYALGVLSRRRVSRGQMRESLRRKGYSDTEAETAIAKLVEWGYLDDKSYSREILRSMLAACPIGRRRAVFELTRKLFDKQLIEEAVDEVFAGLGEEELAALAARKYLSEKKSVLTTEKERERLARWLQRRGFGYEAISSALRTAGWTSGDGQLDSGIRDDLHL
ncbi:MAG TPA: regulatory protein RecX [Firmicutes bacterium]|nr:regulatory protein RecX [Candidatus Fermentithermobacillaceae bacterium]